MIQMRWGLLSMIGPLFYIIGVIVTASIFPSSDFFEEPLSMLNYIVFPVCFIFGVIGLRDDRNPTLAKTGLIINVVLTVLVLFLLAAPFYF